MNFVLKELNAKTEFRKKHKNERTNGLTISKVEYRSQIEINWKSQNTVSQNQFR